MYLTQYRSIFQIIERLQKRINKILIARVNDDIDDLIKASLIIILYPPAHTHTYTHLIINNLLENIIIFTKKRINKRLR